MADTTLQDLIDSLKNYTYKGKTSEQIKQQAQGRYQSYYDQLRLAARQQNETSDLSLQQQKKGLQASYDKQRELSQKQYTKAYSQADRQALSRGMQRSSYNNQTLANINQEGIEAQQAISEQQTAAETNIDQQRTQLATQLASQISQYSAAQASDVMNYMSELEDKEYDRSTTARQYKDSLTQQIYQMLYQEKRDSVQDEQWKREFEERVRQYEESKEASRTSSTGGGGNTTQTTSNGTNSTSNFWDLLNGRVNKGVQDAVANASQFANALGGKSVGKISNTTGKVLNNAHGKTFRDSTIR